MVGKDSDFADLFAQSRDLFDEMMERITRQFLDLGGEYPSLERRLETRRRARRADGTLNAFDLYEITDDTA